MISKRIRLVQFLLFSFFMSLSVPSAQAIEPELWQKLQTGKAVVLLRHALAPGNGDPVEFTLGDCTTQRNLSEQGRTQAVRIGALLKSEGIDKAAVYSSQWCRCVDTANGLGFGDVTTLPSLNSFYQNRSTENKQTGEILQWIKDRLEISENATNLPAVLVTHQVNITSLTGVFPSSGELVMVEVDGENLVVLGTLKTQ